MKITSGKIAGAKRCIIYGPEGIGKSTFAAAFPGPLFIDTEGSTKEMDVPRLPTPESWTMLMQEIEYAVHISIGVFPDLLFVFSHKLF